MANERAIGVYGGMFDPVHNGHLRTMLDVKQTLGLQQVRLIPCALPPHRGQAQVSAEQRVAMLRLAVAGEQGVVIDEREIQRSTPSYSYDTLLSLRSEMADTPICLIIGMDAFKGLMTWHRWQELLTLCHLVVMTRPGFVDGEWGALDAFVSEHRVEDVSGVHEASAGRLYFCPVTALDISSTRIRELLQQGKSIRYLVPDAVRAYIADNGLYGM